MKYSGASLGAFVGGFGGHCNTDHTRRWFYKILEHLVVGTFGGVVGESTWPQTVGEPNTSQRKDTTVAQLFLHGADRYNPRYTV
jgi:hypothetical protein